MRPSEAWDVMARHELIPRRQSKIIVQMITGDRQINPALLPTGVNVADIKSLRTEYKGKKATIGRYQLGKQPRNLPLYMMIKETYKDFTWRINSTGKSRDMYEVTLTSPYIERVRPSLASLLLKPVFKNTSNRLYAKYDSARELSLETVSHIEKLLSLDAIISPSKNMFDILVSWVKKAQSGQKTTIIAPVCPDYAAEEVGTNIYRYTFDSVGNEIGLVAQRLLNNLPTISDIFKDMKLDVDFIVALGDFEAFSINTQNRVGANEATLISRFRISQSRFNKACTVPVQTILFTDLVQGKDDWNKRYKIIFDAYNAGNRGNTQLSHSDMVKIMQSRRKLYQRWHRPAPGSDLLNILNAQAAEYSTMGSIISDSFENPMILGSDHFRMLPFFLYSRALPTIYLKQNYVEVE